VIDLDRFKMYVDMVSGIELEQGDGDDCFAKVNIFRMKEMLEWAYTSIQELKMENNIQRNALENLLSQEATND